MIDPAKGVLGPPVGEPLLDAAAFDPDASVELRGAISLLPPASGAHCTNSCDHKRCALVHEAASASCMVCQKPNGYRRPIYWYRSMQGHADCIADAVDKKLEPLKNLILRQEIEEVLAARSPPSRLAGPGEPGAACPRKCAHEECATHRALASLHCFKCSKPVGYQRPMVMRVEGYAHADCAGVSAKVLERTKADVMRVNSRELHRFSLQERYEINIKIPSNSRPRRARAGEASVPAAPAPPAALATPATPFLGRWRIDWMALWDTTERGGTAFIAFEQSAGKVQFATITGTLACDYSARDGSPLVEFSWSGSDKGTPANGRGWATFEPDGSLKGRFFVQQSNDSEFTATRSSPAPAQRRRSTT